MASITTTDALQTKHNARIRVLTSLLGVWATSLILHIILNAKCHTILAILDLGALGFCIRCVFRCMNELFCDVTELVFLLSAISSLCGLGYTAFVQKGQTSFEGFVGRVGWPAVATITVVALIVVVLSLWYPAQDEYEHDEEKEWKALQAQRFERKSKKKARKAAKAAKMKDLEKGLLPRNDEMEKEEDGDATDYDSVSWTEV